MSENPTRPVGTLGRLRARIARAADLVWRSTRLITFVLVVLAGAVVFFGYRARAQVGEVLLSLGAQMMQYDEARRQDEPRALFLNGERLSFASGTTDHEVSRVLDYYEARCAERAGHFAEQFRAVAASRGITDPEGDGDFFDGVLRAEEDDRGVVACLDMGAEAVAPEGIAARWERFQRTNDLSDFGALRYVYARRADGRTHFVTFWTDGSFKLLDMFPTTGDAPGRDPEDVPRPPDGRRLFAAYEDGHPQSMTVYEGSARDAAGLRAYYRDAMDDAGWHLLELPTDRDPHAAENAHTLVFERAERMVTLVFSDDDVGGGTTTVLVSR
jgi:hypothetical protein